jgi:polynucleotide 5'-triphosphatase
MTALDDQQDSADQATVPTALPPLSLSILGVEPLDEFIKEVADFVHHMINTRPDISGLIELEAKIGVLKDLSGQRLALPILVETSTYLLTFSLHLQSLIWLSAVLRPREVNCRFESNMSLVSLLTLIVYNALR